jgi:hypothetical protein
VLARLNVGAKVLLGVLLLHAVVFPDLPQYEGKGIGWRLLLYPLSALVVPIVWYRLGARRARWAYPHLVDLCVVLPFVIDTAGNAANLYDTVSWWDDAMHFVTWLPWVVALGLAVRYAASLTPPLVFSLTVGFGAATHIVWELLEYVAFIRGNPDEYETAYRDTIGDLTLSLLGSIAGAAISATVLWSVGRPRPAAPAAGSPAR